MALSLAKLAGGEASKAVTEAWEAARIMEDTYWRGKALRVVALSLVQAGQGELALEVARTIEGMPPAEPRHWQQWRCP